jgi:lipoprotein NlpI
VELDYFLALKKLIFSLMEAERDLTLFEEGVLQDRLTFAALSRHNLLDTENLKNVSPITQS